MVSTVADMLPRLLPEVPGCPENYASLILRDAVREVLRFTEAWTKELTAINIVAAQATYNLNPAVTTVAATEPEILRIVSAKLQGVEMAHTNYSLTGVTAAPYFALTFRTENIPTVSVTGGLVVTVALAPVSDAESATVFVLNKVYSAALLLAASNLMQEAGKKYYNPQLSVIKRRQYWRSIGDIAYQRETGRIAASPIAYGTPFL